MHAGTKGGNWAEWKGIGGKRGEKAGVLMGCHTYRGQTQNKGKRRWAAVRKGESPTWPIGGFTSGGVGGRNLAWVA